MPKKRLVMETDYYDLAWEGWTKDDVERLFAQCAQCGITDMFWSVATCGLAEYHSGIMPWYDGRDRREGSARAAEVIRSFDGLALAVELGKKYNINIIVYFRMFDDYYPGMIDETVNRISHGWWESRCGNFQLLGWPDYWLEEVRDYKMKLVREIAGYGVKGFLFGLTRSHSLYVNPFRQPHFWGYNKTVADEYLHRYGVDIRRFKFCRTHSTSEGSFARRGLLFTHEFECVGAEEFDLVKWHELKAEGALMLIRQVRRELGPKIHIAIEASHYACPPFADLKDDYPAKMFFYPNDLAKEGLINEWVMSDNWRTGNFDFDGPLLPNFQEVLDAGAQMNVWMNDIFSPTGGESDKCAGPKQVEEYLEKFLESKIAWATIHETAFLEQNPHVKEIWKVFQNILK
jgi:hypothetical protein